MTNSWSSLHLSVFIFKYDNIITNILILLTLSDLKVMILEEFFFVFVILSFIYIYNITFTDLSCVRYLSSAQYKKIIFKPNFRDFSTKPGFLSSHCLVFMWVEIYNTKRFGFLGITCKTKSSVCYIKRHPNICSISRKILY